YIIIHPPEGEQIDNDDGPNGTNARIDQVLPADGEYRVLVTSFRPGETGDYQLSIAPSEGPARVASVMGGQRVFALMVGVSDYGETANNLPNTDEDARKLADSLRRAGVLNPASIVLTNAEGTREGVRSAFARVAAQAGPDDMFLFFYSGHGNQVDSSATATEPDAREEEITLRDGGMTDDELAALFGTLHTRLALAVLDSCYSGGFARDIVNRPGVMGIFSSEEDLTSLVADKFEAGGYLSYFIRSALAGEADDNGDRVVSAGELATYLRTNFASPAVGPLEAETTDGQRNYQNLVIERGGVQVDDVVVRLGAVDASERREERTSATPPANPALGKMALNKR
ncbi:MAG: caspase family protein, partial [Sphingopyxis sp.]